MKMRSTPHQALPTSIASLSLSSVVGEKPLFDQEGILVGEFGGAASKGGPKKQPVVTGEVLGVLWDLTGTITDDEMLHRSTWEMVTKYFSVDHVIDWSTIWEKWHGIGNQGVYDYLIAMRDEKGKPYIRPEEFNGSWDDVKKLWFMYYKAQIASNDNTGQPIGYKLRHNITQCFNELAARKADSLIVTNDDEDILDLKKSYAAIPVASWDEDGHGSIRDVIAPAGVHRKKPHPDLYLAAMRDMAARHPDKIIRMFCVEDSEPGLRAAKIAAYLYAREMRAQGLENRIDFSVRLHFPFTPDEALSKYGTHKITEYNVLPMITRTADVLMSKSKVNAYKPD